MWVDRAVYRIYGNSGRYGLLGGVTCGSGYSGLVEEAQQSHNFLGIY